MPDPYVIQSIGGQLVVNRNGERIVATTRDDLARLVMQSDRRAEQREQLKRMGFAS